MKTLDEIRAFWEALPGAASFAQAFGAQIAAVEDADATAKTAENAARTARGRHTAVLATLKASVETEATAEWSPHDIEAARGVALRRSLELAAAH